MTSQLPRVGYGSVCAIPGCSNPAEQLHHMVFGSGRYSKERRTAKWKRYLNNPLNLAPTCKECNVITRKANHHSSLFAWIWDLLHDNDRVGDFIEWFDSYPGKRVNGSRWMQVNDVIIAIGETLNTPEGKSNE